MGYGVKPLGYWNGAKFLSWRMKEGTRHAKLQEALDIWQKSVGVTFSESFTQGAASPSPVDFEVVNGGSQSNWSAEKKTLFLKGHETLGAMLHEVGHLLGMSHEHDRPDCRDKWYTANPGVLGKETSIKGAEIREAKLQVYGPIDIESIMQYPQDKYQAATAPSAGDIATVKAINNWT